uniref:Large neutral amino acids transporter small subunit 1-like isoform X1 n=2 Tax=Hirondellea gigas TaxID=1518452 RepID=A0A6A7G6Y4_9CRUS
MRIQTIFTGAKLLALVVIIVAGLVFMVSEDGGWLSSDPPDGEEIIPATVQEGTPDGLTVAGVALAFYSGLFAYGGWNYLNFVTEELKDPYRNLPRAIWIGLPLVSVLYVLVNMSYLAVLPAAMVATSPAVAVDFGRAVLGPLQYCVPVFVALSTFGSLNGILFTSGRLFQAAARQGHMPAVLAFVDVRASTPKPALLASCTLSLCLLGLDIIALINCLSFVLWLSIGAATAALLWLRHTEPLLHRPIKVPLVLPIAFLLCCLYLVIVPLITAPRSTGLGVLMTLSALPVYVLGNTCKHYKCVQRANRQISHCIQKCLTVVCPEYSKPDQLLDPDITR